MDKFDKAHMRTANVYARLSPAKRLKVGTILVKEGRIISIGYNGTPSGWSNECEYPSKRGALTGNVIELKTKPEVLHAETNAIAKVAKSSESSEGATLYTTHAPCLECSKLIYQSGIISVYYEKEYRTQDGIKFLQKSGVHVRKM
tara:strand:+ start:6449 stop:6883 length:435 start_codon:yes stop_codon:yes gene_type:complete